MSKVINKVHDEEIEILDVLDEEVNIKKPLKKKEESIEEMLKYANEELLEHTQKIMEYSKKNKSYNILKEDHSKLDKENKKNKLKLSEYEIALKKLQEENIELRKKLEKNKKKLVTVQSILQVVINSYGINNVIKIIGIPYIKLKEYLQD